MTIESKTEKFMSLQILWNQSDYLKNIKVMLLNDGCSVDCRETPLPGLFITKEKNVGVEFSIAWLNRPANAPALENTFTSSALSVSRRL